MENFEELLKKAENGDAEAQIKVGNCYLKGDGREMDYTKAFEWYHKAAEQGNAVAQYRLGLFFFQKKDFSNAVHWYTEALDNKNTDPDLKEKSLLRLGDCFYKGLGAIRRDYDSAVFFYEQAAKLGNVDAQIIVGNCYANGQGVKKDEKKAFKWISQAAEKGSAEAQNYLGEFFSKGIGVTINKKEAEKWYKKAAEQGYEQAKINLGRRYVFGKDEDVETQKKRIRKLELIILPFFEIFKSLGLFFIIITFIIIGLVIDIYNPANNIDSPFDIIPHAIVTVIFVILFLLIRTWANKIYEHKNKERNSLLKEISELEEDEQRKKAEAGDKEAQERILATQKKKDIDEIVKELNSDNITGEHTRVKRWYQICLSVMGFLLIGFASYMYWNVTSITKEICWQEIIIRILISMSFLSLIFILMNQAARSRKTMLLVSKEIQEFKYIGALLKGKVGLSPDSDKTNTDIDKALDDMIKQHLYIQRKRLEKEDHSEVKDITPEVLNFFKDNTTSIMGNFNEMQKNILELQKTIVQTINNQKKE